MFEPLTSQLTGELQTVRRVLSISESLRDLLISHHDPLSQLQAELPADADDNKMVAHALGRLIPQAPEKLDWQIYDHCAALTRIYAAYERFVSDLVGEYVRLLPELYSRYSDLPTSITKQHRLGIGQILRKMGDRGPYKNLEEQTVVRQLANALSGARGYSLIIDAFFIDRQNLRFETLEKLFGMLGFTNCGKHINKHPTITDFMRRDRSDVGSAEKELQNFIEYRNEAAHKKVENLLSNDEIGTMGRFINALGIALAEMVEEAILNRHMNLAHYSTVLTICETHYNGQVVIGTPENGVRLKVGDDVIIFAGNTCRPAILESIQLGGNQAHDVVCDGATEVGLRLNKRASTPGELRRLRIPEEGSKQISFVLADSTATTADTADTDLADTSEQEIDPSGDPEEQATAE